MDDMGKEVPVTQSQKPTDQPTNKKTDVTTKFFSLAVCQSSLWWDVHYSTSAFPQSCTKKITRRGFFLKHRPQDHSRPLSECETQESVIVTIPQVIFLWPAPKVCENHCPEYLEWHSTCIELYINVLNKWIKTGNWQLHELRPSPTCTDPGPPK